jgi:hypothetical protein
MNKIAKPSICSKHYLAIALWQYRQFVSKTTLYLDKNPKRIKSLIQDSGARF